MLVRNLHTRRLAADTADVAALLDSLSSEDDRLWPWASWPPMRFDRTLSIGARGGHGPIRYTVAEYEPGRRVRFRFDAPKGFDGYHEFRVDECPSGITELNHLLAMEARGRAHLTWPLFFRTLQDALLEECLDKAEMAITGEVRTPYRRTPYQRTLLRIIARVGI
ncbi:SRPBCC family protein [Rhodococcus sp. NPDC058521]|uniref:SRPBCC family protein n=1 Tax=Rhodococcus sp. NPDC058521 TaxID=3346536 RepID=UPI003662AB28